MYWVNMVRARGVVAMRRPMFNSVARYSPPSALNMRAGIAQVLTCPSGSAKASR
jgi:hypothetical protein